MCLSVPSFVDKGICCCILDVELLVVTLWGGSDNLSLVSCEWVLFLVLEETGDVGTLI